MVTLTSVEGSSPRRVGAQMAVAADGRHGGSLSGGCIEAAIVAEAQQAIAEGRARLVRFGRDSPYIDIRLPCGSGLDLLFSPLETPSAIDDALHALANREPAELGWAAPEPDAIGSGTAPLSLQSFSVRYRPALRIVAIGEGDDLVALARLACVFGVEVELLSPDRRALTQLADIRVKLSELTSRTSLPALSGDPSTAFVFLFHDRDWEEPLLAAALDCPHFYIGAIGSRRAQAGRLKGLRAAGIEATKLAALKRPVGLLPRAKDPATLALSILADIVQHAGLDDGLGPSVRRGTALASCA